MDRLLKLLRENAIESPANLGRMLNLSADDVKARIAGYEKAGVIKGYQAVINEDKLDLERVRAFIEVRITPERQGGYNRVALCISKFPEVESVYLMSGAYDLLVHVRGRNLREVALFVSEKLATIEGVVSTATHFMLKTYKDQGVLMEGDEKNERLTVSP
jgi:DNA-binding Lrp family transcriptional regulator